VGFIVLLSGLLKAGDFFVLVQLHQHWR